jgi:hypothetical protein
VKPILDTNQVHYGTVLVTPMAFKTVTARTALEKEMTAVEKRTGEATYR